MRRLFILLPGLLECMAERVRRSALLSRQQGEGQEKWQEQAGRVHGEAHLIKGCW